MARDTVRTGTRTQPRTYLDEVEDLNAQAKDFHGALPGAAAGEDPGDLGYYRTKGGLLRPPALVLPPAWRIGDLVHNYHFHEAKGHSFPYMREGGVRFSHLDTPFPTILRLYPTTGTWSFSTGFHYGLKANVPSQEEQDEGPAILLPLHRSSNWKLTVRFLHPSQLGGGMVRLCMYALTGNQKIPFWGMVYDLSAASSVLNQRMYYNYGNDTMGTSSVDTNLPASNSAVREVAIARFTNCFGIYYDPAFPTYGGTWQWHSAPPNSATYFTSYTESYVGIQITKRDTAALSDFYIKSIQLEYLT